MDLAALNRWVSSNNLEINAESPVSIEIDINIHIIRGESFTFTVKYLGLTFSRDLKWNEHIYNE